jgi:protein tyrosine/serine phosphatase
MNDPSFGYYPALRKAGETMRVVRKPFRTAAVAVLTAIIFSVPASASAATDQAPQITIENFAKVSDTYYRGAQPEGDDFAQLAALGVKTIIDLTDEHGKGEAARRAGLKFVQIPMSSTTPPAAAQVEEFLHVVNDTASQPVYVHCKGGRHRTGTLTAVYRMQQGWTAERAYKEMLDHDFAYGFGHGNQKKFVFEYGANLERTRVTSTKAATQQ